jgi:thymidylate synthase (FAD)
MSDFDLVYPSFEIMKMPNDLKVFERAARTCYQSEDKIKEGSDLNLLRKIVKMNHTAMVEFMDDLVVRFKTNLGVSHELVRMRLCSFAQSSTRYIKYNGVEYIIPWWTSEKSLTNDQTGRNALFLEACEDCSKHYQRRIDSSWTPQEARGCLIKDTSTYINMKANMREWMHIFGLRCDSPAHPDMRVIMNGLLTCLYENSEIVRELCVLKPELQDDLTWFKERYTNVQREENIFTIVNNEDIW